jgi:hypothetical protein
MRKPAAISLAGIVLVLGSIEDDDEGGCHSDPSGPPETQTSAVRGKPLHVNTSEEFAPLRQPTTGEAG